MLEMEQGGGSKDNGHTSNFNSPAVVLSDIENRDRNSLLPIHFMILLHNNHTSGLSLSQHHERQQVTLPYKFGGFFLKKSCTLKLTNCGIRGHGLESVSCYIDTYPQLAGIYPQVSRKISKVWSE